MHRRESSAICCPPNGPGHHSDDTRCRDGVLRGLRLNCLFEAKESLVPEVQDSISTLGKIWIPHTLVGPASNTRTVRRQSDMGYRQRTPDAVVGVLIRLEWFPTGRAKIPRLEES